MKKILTLAIASLAMYACSSGPEEVDLPSASTSQAVVFDQEPPSDLYCSCDAQVLHFNFTVNSMWNIPADATGFITTSPSRGFEGAQSISVNVQENTGAARIQTLKISCLADDSDLAIRHVTIHQEAAPQPPLPPFSLSPIFTFETAPMISIGDYYDFTLTGIDEVRIGGADSTVSFIGATIPDWEKYVSVSAVPGQPNKVRVTNTGIQGGLRWPIQFLRCADGSTTTTSYVNIPDIFLSGLTTSEAYPELCLMRGIKKAILTFDGVDDPYNDVEIVSTAAGAFSLERIPGTPRSLYLKNNSWNGGKLSIRFKRKRDGALSRAGWITSDGSSYVPFVEISPGMYGSSSSAHRHDNYYQVTTGNYSLYFNTEMKTIVVGQVKVTLDTTWPSPMFYTRSGTPGYNYYSQKNTDTNPQIPVIDNYGVSYIDSSVKSISVEIPAIGSTMYRNGTITLEYLSETAIIDITQQP